AGDRHDAAHRLDLAVIARAEPRRASLAEAADGAIDQPRINLRQRGVADAELVHHAGAEIFHDDVGFGCKLLNDRDRLGLGEIERQAALVAVDRLPSRREPALGPFAAQRRAPHVFAFAPFHLYDLGA